MWQLESEGTPRVADRHGFLHLSISQFPCLWNEDKWSFSPLKCLQLKRRNAYPIFVNIKSHYWFSDEGFSLFVLKIKKDFDALKQTQQDGQQAQNSLKYSTEKLIPNHQMNEKLDTGHREATMELLKLKDRAIELERNVSFLFPVMLQTSLWPRVGCWDLGFELRGIWWVFGAPDSTNFSWYLTRLLEVQDIRLLCPE